MFASRIVRNVGAMGGAGNRLMNDANGNRTMLIGAGGLAFLTGLVYWAGWKAEGTSKAGRENLREFEARAQQQASSSK